MIKKSSGGAIIGVEINTDSFRLVKTIKSGDKLIVLDFSHCSSLKKSSASGDAPVDMAQQLVSLIGAKEIKKAQIHCTIPCRNLCIRVVTMPVMPHQELYQAIRSKIHKYFSADLDQVYYNFSVIGETEERGSKKLEVVFAAIQKSTFNKYFQKFESIGMRPKLITPTCFASWGAIRTAGLSKDATTMMLVNIDSHDTDLTVCSENQFVFTRNISIGASDFFEILAGQSQLSSQKPDAIKALWSSQTTSDSSVSSEQNAIVEIGKRLQAEGEMLRKEIELTTHHHYQSTHGGKIDKCILLGEGARVAGLIDFLKQTIDMPLVGFLIRENIVLPEKKQLEFKESAAEYVHALGAVLSSPEAVDLSTVLTPRQKKSSYVAKIGSPSKILTGVIATFIVLPVLAFLLLKGFNLYYSHQIESYEKRQQKIEGVTVQLMSIKKEMDILEAKKKLYGFLLKRYPPYSSFIMEICKAIPEGKIVIDDLSISGVPASSQSFDAKSLSPLNFVLKGRIVGENVQSAQATDFVLALEKSGHFENISIKIDASKSRQKSALGESIKELGFVLTGNVGLG